MSDPRFRVARWATLLVFFGNGFGVANWFVRIPDVVDRLQLSEATIGLALIGVGVGSLITAPLFGALISRLGSRLVVTIAVVLVASSFLVAVSVPSAALLFGALVLGGVATAMLDIGANAQGVVIEAGLARPVMSSFTAAFSIGGFAGALVGGAVAQAGVGLVQHFGVLAVVLVTVAAIAGTRMLPTAVGRKERPAFVRPTRRIALLALIVFCVFFAEGAVGDWGALYLEDSIGAGPVFAGYGLAAFSLMQAVGRLGGDRLMTLVTPAVLVRVGSVLAAVGFGVALAVGGLWPTLAGFGALGLGLSIALPAALSAAGTAGSAAVGPVLATVGVGQYAGAFLGAPSIGFVAENTGLGTALGAVVVLCLVVTVLAGQVGSARRAAPAVAT